MKAFCFTVDDNIRFFKEITENHYQSIFEHPYLAMYRRLHREFGLKVQLNLFYRMNGFDLSQMSAAYYHEWEQNSDWLKLSFHSDHENPRPYQFSDYEEVYQDCKRVNEQIIRFASPKALAETTTVHCCLATQDGLKALADHNTLGLLGLFGDPENPRTSYGLEESIAAKIRSGETVKCGDIRFASIDIVLNCHPKEKILELLEKLSNRDVIRVMIHEQYFYEDYRAYQPNFEEKLRETFSFFRTHGYQSTFFEHLIE